MNHEFTGYRNALLRFSHADRRPGERRRRADSRRFYDFGHYPIKINKQPRNNRLAGCLACRMHGLPDDASIKHGEYRYFWSKAKAVMTKENGAEKLQLRLNIIPHNLNTPSTYHIIHPIR
jgi:hypothetical protein